MQAKVHMWQVDETTNPALLVAGEQPHTCNTRPQRVVHPSWALDYTVGGGMKYRVNRASCPWISRIPDSFHLYAPKTIYWEASGEAQSSFFISSSLLFRGGHELGLDYLVRDKGYAVLLDTTGKLRALMSQVAEVGHREGDAGFAKVQSLLWEAAALLQGCKVEGANLFCTNAAPDEPREIGLPDRIDSYLQQHLADRITLADVARDLHLSPSAISHHYKEIRGRSPIASLIEMRIQTAKVLLMKGYPLKSIAAQTGFLDAFHLSRTFKRVTGLSPKEFSKRMS